MEGIEMNVIEEKEDLWCSTGPVSSMPGSLHPFPEGACCDQHSDRLAVKRVQGETDSMGCEYFLACQECYDAYREDIKNGHGGTCDWCKLHFDSGLRTQRDAEEGPAGRVYYVCEGCRKEYNEYWEREAALDYALDWDQYDDFDDEYMCAKDDEELYIMEDVPANTKQVFIDQQSGRLHRHGNNSHIVVVEVPKRISRKKLRKMAQEAARAAREKKNG